MCPAIMKIVLSNYVQSCGLGNLCPMHVSWTAPKSHLAPTPPLGGPTFMLVSCDSCSQPPEGTLKHGQRYAFSYMLLLALSAFEDQILGSSKAERLKTDSNEQQF